MEKVSETTKTREWTLEIDGAFAWALIALAIMLLAVPLVAFAQEGETTNPLGLLQQLVIVVIPVVSALVLQFVKRAVAAIPNEYLPILAPIVGMLTQAVGAAFGVDLTPGLQGAEAAVAAGALGMTAVGAHQVKQQLVNGPRIADRVDVLQRENERLRADLARARAR